MTEVLECSGAWVMRGAWARGVEFYNSRMPSPLALDTAIDVERRQVEVWRAMTSAQRAALISGLTQAAHRMAVAGVRQRHPDAAPDEQFLRLAIVILGSDLARRAYPDAAALVMG